MTPSLLCNGVSTSRYVSCLGAIPALYKGPCYPLWKLKWGRFALSCSLVSEHRQVMHSWTTGCFQLSGNGINKQGQCIFSDRRGTWGHRPDCACGWLGCPYDAWPPCSACWLLLLYFHHLYELSVILPINLFSIEVRVAFCCWQLRILTEKHSPRTHRVPSTFS